MNGEVAKLSAQLKAMEADLADRQHTEGLRWAERTSAVTCLCSKCRPPSFGRVRSVLLPGADADPFISTNALQKSDKVILQALPYRTVASYHKRGHLSLELQQIFYSCCLSYEFRFFVLDSIAAQKVRGGFAETKQRMF